MFFNVEQLMTLITLKNSHFRYYRTQVLQLFSPELVGSAALDTGVAGDQYIGIFQ